MTKREVHAKTQMIHVTPNPTEHPDRVAVDRGAWNNIKRDQIISQLRKRVAPCYPSDSDRIAKLEDLLVTIRDIAYRHVGHTPDAMRRALSDIATRVDELDLSTD